MTKEGRKIWLAAPLPFFWKERNKVVFENEDFSVHRLKSSFVFSLYSWARLCLNFESLFVCNLVSLVRGS